MAFMVPQYVEGQWAEVENRYGESTYVPADCVELEDGERVVRTFEGVGCRLSAPGYMDCTEWAVFPTEEEAREYIRETDDVDDDTGEDLEEEERE